MSQVLIVDDEQAICWSLKKLMEADGHQVVTASSAEAGLDSAKVTPPDVIILDVRLPGMSGLEAIAHFKAIRSSTPIILITAFGDLATAVEAFQKEVTDYLTKPFDLDRAAEVIRTALASQHRSNDKGSAAGWEEISKGHGLIGRSAPMQEVFKKIALASASDVSVLITGESGTGKELTAAAIHGHSARRERPYLPIALPALNPTLIESELFGHVKGAFTGAHDHRSGLFAMASQGTVLLDEIGDLPLAQQVKLLRVLEHGHYTPVGDIRPRNCDVRILAATHEDLSKRVSRGEFRQDLFFRLAVFEIRMPALRERIEDIPLLCQHLLARMGYTDATNAIESETMAELQSRQWEGNVRELRNVLEHAAIMARGGRITKYHLPPPQSTTQVDRKDRPTLESLVQEWFRSERKKGSTIDGAPTDDRTVGLFDRFLEIVEPILLREALDSTQGNRANAALLLGVHRATLREKLRRYGVGEES